MLQVNKSRLGEDQRASAHEFLSPAELYATTAAFLHRQFSAIVITLFIVLATGVGYLLTAAPRYTGDAVLVIDTHKPQMFQGQSQAQVADLPIDSAVVDTQIEILKSEKIATSVIKELHLDNDPEFIAPKAGFIGTIIGFVTFAFIPNIPSFEKDADNQTREYRRMRTAVWTLENNLKVKRSGLTYVIELEFKSLSPDRAAQVANAIADAYIVDTLEAKYQTTREAAKWLQTRLKDLQQEATAAERAVVAYKQKNNIVDTGGRLINEQQIAELNSALIQARAMTAEAKARVDRVQEILAAGDVDPAAQATATVTDTLKSEVINKLRSQYLDYEAKASLWTSKYGANHLAVVNLRNQMRELRRSIFAELERTAESFKSDYEIAKAREESMERSLNKIIAESQTTNEAQITLRNLQSNAENYRAIYDSFLQRHMESVQQQSFPISEARVITRATRPLQKSSPKPLLVLGLAGVGGLLLGLGVGVLRDLSDRVFRTTSQIEERLRATAISVVPLISNVSRPEQKEWVDRSRQIAHRIVVPNDSLLWTVANTPLSRFAESIRAIKVAADTSGIVKASKVIGITSSLPNEGKSTIAVALAELIAHGGGRVLLVDCDLRNPSLSRDLARGAEIGLLELISNRATLEDVLWVDEVTGFDFLPTVAPVRLTHSTDILGAESTRKVFEELRETYNYVIVDLSPIAPVVDVRVVTHLVDTFVFIAEWGRTKIDVAEYALANARGVYENLLGVVLNKVNMNSFARYQSYRSNYYFNRYYSRYGYLE